MSTVEPLEEGEELTDTTGKKWTLGKLLSQSTTELIYEGEAEPRAQYQHLTDTFTSFQTVLPSSSKESNHILKLVSLNAFIGPIYSTVFTLSSEIL